MNKPIKVGDKAPSFTLPDTELKYRSLEEFFGKKTVLAFFVGAFTATCTKEACAFRDSMARLINLNAQVVGISVNDPFSNKVFAEKTGCLSLCLAITDVKLLKNMTLNQLISLDSAATRLLNVQFLSSTGKVLFVTCGFQMTQTLSLTMKKYRKL